MKRTMQNCRAYSMVCGLFALVLTGTGCQSTQHDEAANVVEPAVTQTEAATKPGMAQHETLPGEEIQQTEAQQPRQQQPVGTDRSNATQDIGFKDNVWMEGQVGTLLRGIDGAPYDPYRPAVIEQTQQKLNELGLYEGAITGVLDESTMQAIGEFQTNNGLHASGVPSPETRKELGIDEESMAGTG
jgi:murein L,D-transpeptidase YcbB/YkuD